MTQTSSLSILMADDDDGYVCLAKQAFEQVQSANHFYSVEDGSECLDFLMGKALPELPSLETVTPISICGFSTTEFAEQSVFLFKGNLQWLL